MATEAEINKIARLLWTERGKPDSGPSAFRDQAKRLLEDRDAICCPAKRTLKQPTKRTDAVVSLSLASPGERLEAGQPRRDVPRREINSAWCDPAAEPSELAACYDAVDAALSAARDT